MSAAIAAGEFAPLAAYVADFQHASQTLKYAHIPTVAAVQGLALGGGCEFLMHCARRVVALESYIDWYRGWRRADSGRWRQQGIRAARSAGRGTHDPPRSLRVHCPGVQYHRAGGGVEERAAGAPELGYLLDSDPIVMNSQELLYVALCEAYAMAEAATGRRRRRGQLFMAKLPIFHWPPKKCPQACRPLSTAMWKSIWI